MFQDYCAKTLNSPTTITYSAATISTQKAVWGITASPIQIRFQASDSTAVPVPTESFKLPKPKKELSTKEKAGIGIGAAAGVILLAVGAFFGWRYWKKHKQAMSFERNPLADISLPDEPPPAYSRTKR